MKTDEIKIARARGLVDEPLPLVSLQNVNLGYDSAPVNEEYVLFLPDGSVRKGRLDGSGKKKEGKIPSGLSSVKFPNLPSVKPD